MKRLTADLRGADLDRAVAVCLGYSTLGSAAPAVGPDGEVFHPSTVWAHGGPLIERFSVTVARGVDTYYASTSKYWWAEEDGGTTYRCEVESVGGTYLEAVMRCIVLARLGRELDFPD